MASEPETQLTSYCQQHSVLGPLTVLAYLHVAGPETCIVQLSALWHLLKVTDLDSKGNRLLTSISDRATKPCCLV